MSELSAPPKEGQKWLEEALGNLDLSVVAAPKINFKNDGKGLRKLQISDGIVFFFPLA